MKFDIYNIFNRARYSLIDIILPAVQRNSRLMEGLRLVQNRVNDRMALKALKTLEAAGPRRRISGEFGVNVAGLISSEIGVGEAARAEIRAIESAGIPFALNDVRGPSRRNDSTFGNFRQDNPYCFNLIHVNADQLQDFFMQKGVDYFLNRYNIGFWFWELSEFPAVWQNRFAFLDEVWAASEFCKDAFSKSSPVPVVKIPLSIEIRGVKGRRENFGLGGEFVFLFVFDFLSLFERKNPLAAIEAFRAAFGSQRDVQLVLKCSNSKWNTKARDRIVDASRGLNMKLIDRYLDKDDLNALVALSDCYVSLHRSEGFGLPLAEAMYLGKPVIATAYSGNMDFMDEKNSFPVKYSLVRIERDHGPYKKGNIWAEPDIGHAAELMRLVYNDRELAQRIAGRGASDIRRNYAPSVAGRRILERLEEIAREKGLPGGRD